MKFIAKPLDVLIPRFLQEDVALVDVGTHYEIVCAMSDLESGENTTPLPPCKPSISSALPFFPKMVGGVGPFQSTEAGDCK